MAYEVELKEIEPQQTASIRDKVARKEIEMHLAELIPRVEDYLDDQGIVSTGRPFARYHNFGPVERVNVDLQVGLPVATDIEGGDEVLPDTLPGCQAAVTRYQGAYDGVSVAYEALREWIDANNYEAGGTPWEIYLNDFASVADEVDWDIQLVWPVKES